MKILVSILYILGAVSAGFIPSEYHGPVHHPVIHNGVPVDTPEVQHAKAAHFAALSKASAQSGYNTDHKEYSYNDNHNTNHAHGYSVQHISHPIVEHKNLYVPLEYHSTQSKSSHIAPAYQTTHVVPAISHDGKPLDTPEVEAAKAHHFAAVHKALSQVVPSGHHGGIQHHYRKRREIYGHHIPIIGIHGLGGHENDHSSGYSIHQAHSPVYGHYSSHSHFIPKFDQHGHPLDTAEVEHAKALHFAAHQEAHARNSVHGYQAGPIETPEVQHAKALHFAAHAPVKVHHY